MSSTAHRLELAHSAASDTIRGIAMQHHRLISELPEDEMFFAGAGFRREVDLQLLLVLVSRLRRVAGVVRDMTNDPPLERELVDFDRQFPAARHMRNVSEHIEDYLAGKGRRQDLVRDGSLGVRLWSSSATGGVQFAWAGQTIDLCRLEQGADGLYRSLCSAVKSSSSP